MYMLHLNADRDQIGTNIIEPVFGNLLVDSALNQFNLMIGEYNTAGFVKHSSPALCYALFIITVIISQITFLNMLIAIMSDTFEKVIEQRPTFSLKNKLMILAAMESMIRSKEADDDAELFLYVITPVISDHDEGIDSQSDDWRGRTHYTHNLIKSKFASISEE